MDNTTDYKDVYLLPSQILCIHIVRGLIDDNLAHAIRVVLNDGWLNQFPITVRAPCEKNSDDPWFNDIRDLADLHKIWGVPNTSILDGLKDGLALCLDGAHRVEVFVTISRSAVHRETYFKTHAKQFPEKICVKVEPLSLSFADAKMIAENANLAPQRMIPPSSIEAMISHWKGGRTKASTHLKQLMARIKNFLGDGEGEITGARMFLTSLFLLNREQLRAAVSSFRENLLAWAPACDPKQMLENFNRPFFNQKTGLDLLKSDDTVFFQIRMLAFMFEFSLWVPKYTK